MRPLVHILETQASSAARFVPSILAPHAHDFPASSAFRRIWMRTSAFCYAVITKGPVLAPANYRGAVQPQPLQWQGLMEVQLTARCTELTRPVQCPRKVKPGLWGNDCGSGSGKVWPHLPRIADDWDLCRPAAPALHGFCERLILSSGSHASREEAQNF